MPVPPILNRVETLERRMTPLSLLPGQIANLTSIVAMALGLVVIYTCGTLWLAYASVGRTAIGLASAFATGVAPFVIADVVKLAAAAGIVPGLWRLIPPSSR